MLWRQRRFAILLVFIKRVLVQDLRQRLFQLGGVHERKDHFALDGVAVELVFFASFNAEMSQVLDIFHLLHFFDELFDLAVFRFICFFLCPVLLDCVFTHLHIHLDYLVQNVTRKELRLFLLPRPLIQFRAWTDRECFALGRNLITFVIFDCNWLKFDHLSFCK